MRVAGKDLAARVGWLPGASTETFSTRCRKVGAGFKAIFEGVDEAFAVPSAAGAADFVGTAGEEDAAALTVQFERLRGLPVERGGVSIPSERRGTATTSRSIAIRSAPRRSQP